MRAARRWPAALLGLALGAALAAAALRWLAGDLGGGYFPGVAPALRFDAPAALALRRARHRRGAGRRLAAGAPRRSALAPAQALKGLGDAPRRRRAGLARPAAAGAGRGAGASRRRSAACRWPPTLSVALPAARRHRAACRRWSQALLARCRPPRTPLPLLAVERARHQRDTATVAGGRRGRQPGAVGGADGDGGELSRRRRRAGSTRCCRPTCTRAAPASSAASDQAWLDPAFVAAVAALPGVQRVEAARVRALQLAPDRPAVALIARPLAEPAQDLPLLAAPLPPRRRRDRRLRQRGDGALYGARPGQTLSLPHRPRARQPQRRARARRLARLRAPVRRHRHRRCRLPAPDRRRARQRPGAVARARRRCAGRCRQRLRRAGAATTGAARVRRHAASCARCRWRIFDRSFAVTYYLQAVAIAIGLVGIAASFSAQVLARRKEFGLLVAPGADARADRRRGRRRRRGLDWPPARCSAWRSAWR